jgi:type II secretory pathway pseudopilin PulG
MVELIFVIVIIGILASVGIPKLSGVSDGAKKTAEIATFSAVSTAIESAHGEWSINEGSFKWGNSRPSSDINDTTGYPAVLTDDSTNPFKYVLKGDSKDFAKQNCSDTRISIFTGPASNPSLGVKFDTKATNSDISGKPDKNDYWVYVHTIATDANCTIGGKVLYLGDIALIDVTGTGTTTYSTLTCN